MRAAGIIEEVVVELTMPEALRLKGELTAITPNGGSAVYELLTAINAVLKVAA